MSRPASATWRAQTQVCGSAADVEGERQSMVDDLGTRLMLSRCCPSFSLLKTLVDFAMFASHSHGWLWQLGGHKRRCAVVLLSLRASVKLWLLSSCLCALSSLWLGARSIFAGWPRWGASRTEGEKRQFEVQSCQMLWVLRGRCCTFGALFPSKYGLIHKHIVKTYRSII
jgi:hypothetical protein